MLANRKVLLAEIESTYQLDAEPVVAADEVLVEALDMSLEGLVMLDRPAVRANIGKLPPVFAGHVVGVTCTAEIKGSGSAGTAPEIGKLLRMCGLGETIVGGTSVTYAPVSSGHESGTLVFYHDGKMHRISGVRGNAAFSFDRNQKPMVNFTFVGHANQQGTAQTGAASTITLATTASATDSFYNNMYIKIWQGTGAGQLRQISGYVGATKVATVSSAWTTTPDSTSVYSITTIEVDSAIVSPTYDSTEPAPFMGMAFAVNSYSAIIGKLDFDLGNDVQYPPNVNSASGWGQIRIVGRAPTGSIDPENVLAATHDFYQELRQGTSMALSTGQIGSAAGNLLNVSMPAITYTNIAGGDRNGISILTNTFQAAESAGDDEISLAFT